MAIIGGLRIVRFKDVEVVFKVSSFVGNPVSKILRRHFKPFLFIVFRFISNLGSFNGLDSE